MPKEQKIKRTFRFRVKVKRAKKEFQEGLGVGCLGYNDYTYNLTQKEYDGPMFKLSLLDKQKEVLDEFMEVHCEEVKE